jgi:hypothetical protein
VSVPDGSAAEKNDMKGVEGMEGMKGHEEELFWGSLRMPS